MQLGTGVCLQERYFLMEVLGIGGTSTVFLAMDERIQRKRAVKAIRKAKFSGQRLWEKESLLLKRLHHRNIAEIFDILEDEEFIYFVMEYVEGYTLRELMSTGHRFSKKKVVDLGVQICEVLSYLHGQKAPILYGDLKPENLMLEKTGRIVLIDFGASRFLDKPDRVCWGTEKYAAPEQKEDWESGDARSDLYSLGIILYEMYYGKNFSGTFSDKPISDLEKIIEKCIRRIPKERYQSAQAVKRELKCSGKGNSYKMKIFCFGTVCSLSIGLLVLSRIFSQQAEILFREGYERYMTAGRRGMETEERVGAFLKAIDLNPWKPDGYAALLEEYRQAGFSQEEYKTFLKLLGKESGQGISYEECLAQSEEAYGRLSYKLGLACYFEWEGYGNKQYAFPWLEQAGKCEKIIGEERQMSMCLASIAAYHGRIKMQEGELTHPEQELIRRYWKDLQKMLEIPRSAELERLVCKEVAGQILQHLAVFQECGIERQELKNCLEEIRTKDGELETVIREGEGLLELMDVAEEKT